MTSRCLVNFLNDGTHSAWRWSCRCGAAEALKSRGRRMDCDHCGWAFAVMAGVFTAIACGSSDAHLNPA